MSEEIAAGIADEQPDITTDTTNAGTEVTGETFRGIAEDESTDAGKADGAGQDSGASDAPEVKPERYELDAVEGFDIPSDNLKSFGDRCNDLGLTKEQAQGVLAWHKEQAEAGNAAMAQFEAQTLKAWDDSLRSDAEFGGANYKRTYADAIKALKVFDPDGSLRGIMRDTKFQFNPDVIKVCARIGAAMGEHGFITRNGNGDPAERSLAERFYPSMGK